MKLLTIALLILCLCLTGCAPGTVLTSLSAAVAATDALVISLAATGNMDPDVATQIIAVISPLPGISQQIVAELSSTDSNALRAAKVTALLAPVLARIDALPASARAIAAATLAAWQAFLSAYPVPAAGNLSASKQSTKFDAKALDKIRGSIVDLTDHAGEMRR